MSKHFDRSDHASQFRHGRISAEDKARNSVEKSFNTAMKHFSEANKEGYIGFYQLAASMGDIGVEHWNKLAQERVGNFPALLLNTGNRADAKAEAEASYKNLSADANAKAKVEDYVTRANIQHNIRKA